MALKIRQTKLIELGDETYTVVQLGATNSNKVLKQLQKIILPVFSQLALSEGQFTPELISVLSEKLENLDEELIKSVICESCNMQPQKYETEFAGRMLSLYELLWEILWFNYEDVFQRAGLERNLLQDQ